MKFAVIGAGVIGQLRARSIVEHPGTGLVGVADANLAHAQKAAGSSGARVCADFKVLVEDPQVEAVVVSTPVQLHEEMAVAALAAG